MPTKDTKDDKENTQEQQAEEETETTANNDQADTQQQAQPETDDSLPKSQDELNKLIERRLKKEQKKWEKAKAQEQQKPAEQTAEGDNAATAAPDNSAELAQLRAELQEAKAQNAAAKLGFKGDVIDDAVYLAMRNAAKNNDGDFDDEDIKTELTAVLKKHPEWKADAAKAAGFRVGAPAPQQGAVTTKPTAQRRWNRFNH